MVLAGCSSLARLAAFEDRTAPLTDAVDRAYAATPTPADEMPMANGAIYRGGADISLTPTGATQGDALAIFGESEIRVDFENSAVTGEVTDMFGAALSGKFDIEEFDVNGTIQIGENSSSIGQGTESNWTADYEGTLETRDGDIELDGVLNGHFGGQAGDGNGAASTIHGDESLGSATRGAQTYEVFIDVGGGRVSSSSD